MIRHQTQKKPLFSIQNSFRSLDQMVLIRHLATLLSAGIPLLQALKSIAQSTQNPKLRKVLESISRDISAGSSFADSLNKHPQFFSPLVCQFIHAAEQSSTLETMLKRLADTLEKKAKLKKKIKKALTYPLAIIILSLFVTLFLMITIVPEFESLFHSFGAKLPLFTRWIISFSHFIQNKIASLLLFILIAYFALKNLGKHYPTWHRFIEKKILALLIVGPLMKKSISAELARTLSMLLEAGLTLVNSLSAAANTCHNHHFHTALLQIRQNVINGHSLHSALSESGLFPSLFVQMVKVGEESSSVPKMLDKIANYYEEDIDQMMSQLSQLLEPCLMLLLGIIVGGFVIAMYLPIFKLGSVF